MNRTLHPDPAEPPQAKRRLSADQRRRMLLDAGQALFGQRPYDEVSLEAISSAAGVSRPLIQHYFGNKRELYRAVFARALEELSDQVHGEPAQLAPPASLDPEAARAKMLDYFVFAASHPAGALVAGRPGGDEVVEALVGDFIDKTTALILQQNPNPPPTLPAALTVWSQMNIALTLRIIREGDIDCDWAADFSTKMLFACVAAA